jgi:CheY-like chemotaxis protein
MPKTLLLADDSVTIQKVVGISFANEDVVLLTVDNGDDAVTRAREARPDLVLADVMMPGKDGYEVCETLKADPELRHVPVLLLSGTFEPFDEERARRAGADGHITKPFEAQALVDQVNALLARAAEPPPALEPAAGEATLAVAGDAADDAFDFFDEEMAQTAPSPSAPAPTLLDDAAEGLEDDALELEAAVEDDAPTLAPPPTDALFDADGDSQATVLFDDEPPADATRRSATPPPFLGDGFDAEALEAPAPVSSPPPGLAPGDAPAGYEESFDFGFEEAAAPFAPETPAPVAPEPPAPLAPPPVPRSPRRCSTRPSRSPSSPPARRSRSCRRRRPPSPRRRRCRRRFRSPRRRRSLPRPRSPCRWRAPPRSPSRSSGSSRRPSRRSSGRPSATSASASSAT